MKVVMGILVPLYLAGLTALSLPLILHLVRRTPRGRQEFSSLMFLAPTPPRLTRRSRLDQILLLLLRLAALALIALAFSRPFLREAASLSRWDLAGRRVALLIDTSASMRRADLWQQAMQHAERELKELNPQDDVALFTFDDRLRTVVTFQREDSEPIADKPALVRKRLQELRPEWGATDLGTALTTVASELDSTTDVRQSALEPRIVVISDFQSGSRIEALQSFEWPERIPVIVHRVTSPATTNAHAHVLPREDGNEDTDARVRIVNAADSRGDQFSVTWANESPASLDSAETGASVHVPPGQSRVIRLPRSTEQLAADRIVLQGDDHDFDNTFFVVPPRKQSVNVLYVGSDAADDTRGLQFYLRLAVANDPLRQVEITPLDVQQLSAELAVPSPQLMVVTQELPPDQLPELKSYCEQGGTLLLVPNDDTSARSLVPLLGDVEFAARGAADAVESTGANEVGTAETVATTESSSSKSPEKYLLLGDIDFSHPLFAPFAGARYSDFTKIHFWKHRPVAVKADAQTRVVARFDNQQPALLEQSRGPGRVLLLTSGWQPDDSQFALSSKFVPFVAAILDLACGETDVADSVVVHEPVSPSLGPRTEASRSNGTPMIFVRTPDGSDVKLSASQTTFTETNRPGIYVAKRGITETRFAVNLASSESNTTPLELEQLEQRGVRFGVEETQAERVERTRQQRDTELEGRQKVWRWLIVLALATLLLETWWAGRAERQSREVP